MQDPTANAATWEGEQGATATGALLAAPVDAPTVPEAFRRTVARHRDRIALRTMGGGTQLTWGELDRRVRSVAAGLATLSLGHGDTMAVLLPNTVECHLADYAAAHLGAIPFTIFNSSSVEQIAYQIGNAGARVAITERQFADKVRAAVMMLDGQVEHLIVIGGGEGVDELTLSALEMAGDPAFDLDAMVDAIDADDIATIIYTSGTTGPPKAAQWSHRTVMAQQRGLDAALPMPRVGIISFLPMAHAGGRINAHYSSLLHGATVTVCPDIRDLPDCLIEARPDALFSTPRLFEKLRVSIEGLIEAETDATLRETHRKTLRLGLRRVTAEDNATDIPARAAQELVEEHTRGTELLKPLLAELGLDRIRAAYIGGAPCPPEIVRFFRAVGMPVLEAYGATEVSLNIFNRLDDFKTGSAGKPLPGVEIMVLDDGELLTRAEMNMVGYRNEPEKTAETIDADGWVHTGDIVTVDAEGFVSIVDRKKEIMIDGAGKNLSPAYIETTISGQSSLIAQVVAIGEGRRHVAALITLDPEALRTFAHRKGLDGMSPEESAASPELRSEVQAAVDRGNALLNGNEQVKRFVLLPAAWVPDSEELTPTAKLKRRVIHAKYAAEIESMYAS
ncbi:AMP-dependent synthetase/ligase [Streptomyces sp. NPDC058001]|uniref:AMP-dependent synthetase/ligase n=1 Tax=Streptomyces sp. NPDC058001 TaxID=3346300 RepID=UPI0036E9E71B